LVELEESALKYYERVNDTKAAASVALFMVEHLYYKHDNHAAAVQQAHAFNKRWGNYADLHPASKGKIPSGLQQNAKVTHPAAFSGNPTASAPSVNYSQKLETLCNFIYKHGDDRLRTRALLCSVYHHALHERYYVARDLFLMSHIQDYIERVEIKTQILFNRTLVMLGLCAFRNGLFQKAHDFLQVICSGRVKELLAQGSTRSPDKDAEQERIEKRRQMPYHMHINPDLLESCHLISAMILELPLLAKLSNIHSSSSLMTSNTVFVSRQLRKYMDTYSRQTFTGPPETVREHIVVATRSILRGDWNAANNLIKSLEVWNLLPAGGGEKVKDMLQVRIREEAIRSYILTNQSNYDSISLELLANMFELNLSEVKKVLCQMIFNKEISASLESNGSILILYKVEPSPLQQICLITAEKLSQLVESNERIVDSLIGVYGYKDDWNVKNKKDGDGRGGDNQQGEGRGGYSGFNKKRGFRSSRPVLAKGTRMATSGRNSSRVGTSTGHQNNRNVWQNKNGNNNNRDNNNNRRNNQNDRNNNYQRGEGGNRHHNSGGNIDSE
jgi:translation initiation factor 3 subunit C